MGGTWDPPARLPSTCVTEARSSLISTDGPSVLQNSASLSPEFTDPRTLHFQDLIASLHPACELAEGFPMALAHPWPPRQWRWSWTPMLDPRALLRQRASHPVGVSHLSVNAGLLGY